MNMPYKDNLIEITDQEIVFHRYYFPFGMAKRVPSKQIAGVEVRRPSIRNGSWRIWGSGDVVTWFPLDSGRPKRDAIFVASLHGTSIRIGFTAEDSKAVVGVLGDMGLLHEPSM